MIMSVKACSAVSVMIALAILGKERGDRVVPIDVLTQHMNVSVSYAEQLLAYLRRAQLVQGVKGPGGGYVLMHEPQHMTLAQIVEAVDGKQGMLETADHPQIVAAYKKFIDAVWERLNLVTLQTIME